MVTVARVYIYKNGQRYENYYKVIIHAALLHNGPKLYGPGKGAV